MRTNASYLYILTLSSILHPSSCPVLYSLCIHWSRCCVCNLESLLELAKSAPVCMPSHTTIFIIVRSRMRAHPGISDLRALMGIVIFVLLCCRHDAINAKRETVNCYYIIDNITYRFADCLLSKFRHLIACISSHVIAFNNAFYFDVNKYTTNI